MTKKRNLLKSPLLRRHTLGYCRNCDVYYIFRRDYENLCEKGTLQCAEKKVRYLEPIV